MSLLRHHLLLVSIPLLGATSDLGLHHVRGIPEPWLGRFLKKRLIREGLQILFLLNEIHGLTLQCVVKPEATDPRPEDGLE